MMSLTVSLKQMLELCQRIQTLLRDDRERFRKNDLPAIEESNKVKTELIGHLTAMINDSNDEIARYSTRLALDDHLLDKNEVELKYVIKELKAEASKCYEQIFVNSEVVFSNMQLLKNIWEEIIANRDDDSSVYDSGAEIR